MTREERIQILRDWDGYFMGHSSDDVNEALNAAIQAIEQEPTTKNDLGVDEVTALAEWTEKLTEANESAYSQGYADGMKAQEPKTGHWIANAPQYDMLNPQYICSECGNAHTRTTPYCEMCGAKMVEPQESEET